VGVCVMAGRSCPSLARVLASLREAEGLGLVDQIVVIGSARAPDGAAVAGELGVRWVDEATLLGNLGPVLGKGDAMWRGLSIMSTDLVVFCDGDNEDFPLHFACGLIGPLLGPDPARFVKATYAREFTAETGADPAGGGRVTELLARPLLEAFFPSAGELRQPLGGEIAAPRELLASLSFMTGYAVEAVMLIDVIEREGIAAVAEVDLGSRGNDHQSLAELGRMAREIVLGIGSRLPRQPPGHEAIARDLEAIGRVILERPPMEERSLLGELAGVAEQLEG
jgi:glucosyl-3-phosphoglycerate synthase